MTWIFWIVLRMAALAVAGVALGALAGAHWHLPTLGAALGGIVAAFVAWALDLHRAGTLIVWLRRGAAEGDLDALGLRGRGLWREIAERMVRALRLRERAGRAHRQQLEQLLAALQDSPVGLLLLDAERRIEWCNATAAAQFGLDAARDRLQYVGNLIRRPEFVAYLDQPRHDAPLRLARADGGALSVQLHPYGDGRELLLTHDVSGLERNEQMRRDFVANVSHEIRTPLTVLAGFIETLQTVDCTPPERAHYLDLMGQQARRMQALVKDLLTLARLEGSPRPSTEHWVAAADIVKQATEEARGLSAGRHRVEGTAGDGAVAGEESELVSALANLASNAVRYTPAGGCITVAWRVLPDGRGEFSVSDTGPGIAKEHLARLTERFYRVDRSRSRETGGTGLGLSIVKHVVLRHGGELLIESEVGKGSTFRLRYPATRVRRSMPRDPLAEEPVEAGG